MYMDLTHSAEVEKLARTLKASRVAVSESEAYRMAEEMLVTSRKVHEDRKAREQEMFGRERRNVESENAQKIMEKISANMAKGRDVRIDIDELDLEKPLKELVRDEPVQDHEEEDDAVLLHEERAVILEPEPPVVAAEPAPEVVEVHNEDDDYFDDDHDDDGEEEKAAVEAPSVEPQAESAEPSEASEEEQGEVSVKEVDFI
jgi:hypothetical protein